MKDILSGIVQGTKKGNIGPGFAYCSVGGLMNKPFRLLVVSLLFTSVGFCQSAQETTDLQHQNFETNLASGASLRLHLHDGDVRVVGTDSEKISVLGGSVNLLAQDVLSDNFDNPFPVRPRITIAELPPKS